MVSASMLLWAKTGTPTDTVPATHPLPWHLLDVAAAAAALWDTVLPKATKEAIRAGLGVPDKDATRTWVVFLAGAHDLGKASPAFQYMKVREKAAQEPVKKLQEQMMKAGLSALERENKTRHGEISTLLLAPLLEKRNVPQTVARTLAVTVGGHHGVFPREGFAESDKEVLEVRQAGGQSNAWRKAHEDLIALLIAALGGLPEAAPTACDNATAMTLAGLVSVADWLGSDESRFVFKYPAIGDNVNAEAQDYYKKAEQTAYGALQALGWLTPPAPFVRTDWETMFPTTNIKNPRPLQQMVANKFAPLLNKPGLLVIETPMGSGKTEAALYAAEHATAAQGLGGYYIALPTQATSNQMFGRVRTYLDARYGKAGGAVNTQLLHGHADLSEEFAQLRQEADVYLPTLGAIGQDDEQDSKAPDPTVIAAGWFTGRRRGLLAPFAVGTVDQGLLAVLQTKHLFVRLFGLAHKVVVIDEVHAYDTYMSTLLERLLEWLAALGCTVILLSATLPRKRRENLFRAYAKGRNLPKDAEMPQHVAYPRISALIGNAALACTVPPGSDAHEKPEEPTSVAVRWLPEPLLGSDGSAAGLGTLLKDQLANGGCAAVICNTVARAQAVYTALKAYFPSEELDLLHARYRFKERDEREKRVLDTFGKSNQGMRPRRALVATQIIEQSLDLDFDVMVSELAPADLVLQRTGHLHRHERGARPTGAEATLYLAPPDAVGDDGVPKFGTSGYVYAPHVLLRSWLELRERTQLIIPDDIEKIIEKVYDDNEPCPDPAMQAKWDETRAKLDHEQRTHRGKAKQNALRPPDDATLLTDRNRQLQEDAPEVNPTLQALTRLSEPSISVVILRADAECDERHLDVRRPSLADARELIRRAAPITHAGVARHLIAEEPPSHWKESTLLRHSRLIVLDADGEYTAPDGKFTLRYDMEKGVEIL